MLTTGIKHREAPLPIVDEHGMRQRRGSFEALQPVTSVGQASTTKDSTAMIRTGPIISAAILVFIVPTLIFYSLRTELTAEERKAKLRDTLGGHPRVDTTPGAYTGKLWKTEQTLGKKLLGETPFARCDVHSVMVGEKKIINDWIFMEERDAVNVAVFTKEGKFLAFEQKKYAIPGDTLSPVGGFINDGESPFDAARREVLEELGVGSERSKQILSQKGSPLTLKDETRKSAFGKAKTPLDYDEYDLLIGNVPQDESKSWSFLGRYRTAANRGGGFIYTYLLVDAVPLIEGGGTNAFISSGDEESQNLLLLNREQVIEAVMNGRFQEVKWAATLALGLLHMNRNNL
jgi:ADP-ribose pyrophosphatase